MDRIKVYGADWCADTQRSLAHLRQRGIAFDYINIEHDPTAAAWVRSQNHGKEKKPTIQVGARILTEPSNVELDEALAKQNGMA